MAFMEAVREAAKFFVKTDPVHETLARVTRRLAEEQIDYALIGGMALLLTATGDSLKMSAF